jgi:ribosomal protein S18 acetylase RimI-like enzyme
MEIKLRRALPNDFGYCKRLYFAGMNAFLEELRLDRASHEAGFQQQWKVTQVRIIVLDGLDVGWLQSIEREDGLFIGQLFVDGAFQGRGVGTDVLHRLIDEAEESSQPVLLSVVKSNPAIRLYQRLGFCITHEDDRKLYMKRGLGPS